MSCSLAQDIGVGERQVYVCRGWNVPKARRVSEAHYAGGSGGIVPWEILNFIDQPLIPLIIPYF